MKANGLAIWGQFDIVGKGGMSDWGRGTMGLSVQALLIVWGSSFYILLRLKIGVGQFVTGLGTVECPFLVCLPVQLFSTCWSFWSFTQKQVPLVGNYLKICFYVYSMCIQYFPLKYSSECLNMNICAPCSVVLLPGYTLVKDRPGIITEHHYY